MKNLKTFAELSKKMDTLSENSKGQLKGGFAVFSGDGGPVDPPDTNKSCTNNCVCSNKKCGNTSCANKNNSWFCSCGKTTS